MKSCNCTDLRKASRRITQIYDAALAETGLKITQRAILAQIARSEPTTVGNLAEALVMDSGALAHTLKPLQRDNLIAIAIDPSDRRNRLISLTPTGRTRLTASDAAWEQTQRAFESAFGKANAKALRKTLRLLASEDFESIIKKHLQAAVKTP